MVSVTARNLSYTDESVALVETIEKSGNFSVLNRRQYLPEFKGCTKTRWARVPSSTPTHLLSF